jgi:hypothetical protein
MEVPIARGEPDAMHYASKPAQAEITYLNYVMHAPTDDARWVAKQTSLICVQSKKIKLNR